MLLLNTFTILIDVLYLSLVVCTVIVCAQLVIKVIIVLADDIKKDLKKNHASTMAAQSTNLANDLQTNELAKSLVEDNKKIKKQLEDIQNSIEAINFKKND